MKTKEERLESEIIIQRQRRSRLLAAFVGKPPRPEVILDRIETLSYIVASLEEMVRREQQAALAVA